MFLIFSKEVEYGINFAEKRLGLGESEDSFLFTNNFDENYVEKVRQKYKDAISIFITKDIAPGEPGVWDSEYIIDDREEVKKWMELPFLDT